jgi:hypothetical protein
MKESERERERERERDGTWAIVVARGNSVRVFVTVGRL